MRALITGNCGFVGRHFTKRLLVAGYDVLGIDNLVAGVNPNVWLPDWTSRSDFWWSNQDVRKYFREETGSKFDLIIHCAAIVGGRLNIDGDPLSVMTNLSIDSEFFSWAVRAKNKPKIVYFSSSAVYPLELQSRVNHVALGEHFVVPAHQLRIGMPDQTYGFSKLAGEVMAHYAVKNYGADVIVYRPFGGYGEDQSLDYPFPSIIKRIVDGENPVTVWGSGDQQRDFIHIEDIVDAVLVTMDKLKPGDALNLGTGMGQSFKQLVNIACGVLNRNVKIVNDPDKPEGVFARVADPYKLSQLWTIPDPMPRLMWGVTKMIKALDGTKSP